MSAEHAPPDPVPARPVPGTSLAERRERALAEACEEAVGVDGHAVTAMVGGAGGIGVRAYAPGRLALALAGRFDTPGLERLREMAPMIERRSETELAIDLSGLRECDSTLARVIGRLRIRRLADGARVTVGEPPVAVRRELGERTDTPSDGPTTIGDPSRGRRSRDDDPDDHSDDSATSTTTGTTTSNRKDIP